MRFRKILALASAWVSRNNSQGFTLVESLMAIFVMSFGLLAVGQLLFVTLGSPALARSKGTAVEAAQNRLESLAVAYRQNPDGPDLTLGAHGPVVVELRNSNDNRLLNRFNVAWTVSTVPDPRAWKTLRAKRVSVTVTPITQDGRVHNRNSLNKVISMTTIFSARPT